MYIILEVLWLICRILYANIEAFVKLFIPQQPKSIRGKVAVVTGAGRGIGREIALGLAKEGAKVAVWDIDETSALQTSNLIKNFDGISVAYTCDVTKPKEVSEVATRVRQDLGEVEILVNNAGVLVCKNILDLEEKEIRRTMEINAVAQFWTVKEFLPNMLSKNSGHIIVIVSMTSQAGSALLTDYCASKYAADGFSKALSAELHRMKKTGINITSVYPMFVNTKLVTDLDKRIEMRDRFTAVMTPQHVASKVVYGLLRNQRNIFVPSKMKLVRLLAFMPQKAQFDVLEFLDVGFFEKPKSM